MEQNYELDNSDKSQVIHYEEIITVFGLETNCPFCNWRETYYINKDNRCPKCGALILLER